MRLEHSNADAQQLVKKAVAGDKNAFGDLYILYLRPIYRYIYYRVGQQAEAEDLTELVFLKVWEALDNYEHRNIPFEAWLYRIARNTVIDNYRTQKNTVSIDEQWSLEDSTQGPESLAIFSEQGEILRNALDRLDADYQEILILRFVAGLNHAEAAVAMGRSEGATRALQHRALAALRDSYHQSQQGL
jgi:RNA polymerase sigma-70 factor (ECF subfamily)